MRSAEAAVEKIRAAMADGRSQRAIAAELGISESALSRFLQCHGLRRANARGRRPRLRLDEALHSGRSAREIAAELGCSPGYVYQQARRRGITLRRARDQQDAVDDYTDRIIAARRALELSQRGMANALLTPINTYRQWEARQRRTPGAAVVAAEFLARSRGARAKKRWIESGRAARGSNVRAAIRWTPEMIALLGTMTDVAAARQLGIGTGSVMNKRLNLGIARYRPITPAREALLGTMSDGALAQLWGISITTVRHRRTELGIRPWTPAP